MAAERKALRHWIKTLVRQQMDMAEARASEKDLSIEEFLSKTFRTTLGEMRAEQVIEDLLTEHPDLEAVYRDLYTEVVEELREERRRPAEAKG
ncbi:hypothetical protein [Caenispirillum bisanense]|uniref:Uncharacterized protein n=1 Tax=Caenispirillum bisanense TaxID=414052 RepID=A0A286GQM8_9PROT|nr:hypothetical protein [Caenispirillum bisanense]SOD97802.1 hypothetical protein SAMN05421508_10787 [Caenispirillum bisanense]